MEPHRFEYFNEPGGDNTLRHVRDFYNAMGDIAVGVDPDRLFSAGILSPHAVGGETNYRAISGSRGVDIASVHEYDADAVISTHYVVAKANSAGKPLIVGEFGLYANETGNDCPHAFAVRAQQVSKKLNAYIRDSANAGSQAHFRTTSK